MFSHLTFLLMIILFVRMFRSLYTSLEWSPAYPTNIHVFSAIIQLGSHLFDFMYGNHCHFTKCSHASHIFCVPSIKQCVGGFVLSGIIIMLSYFIAVEMTSHQNSRFLFESIPAWINMALALPINVGILLSATEFC